MPHFFSYVWVLDSYSSSFLNAQCYYSSFRGGKLFNMLSGMLPHSPFSMKHACEMLYCQKQLRLSRARILIGWAGDRMPCLVDYVYKVRLRTVVLRVEIVSYTWGPCVFQACSISIDWLCRRVDNCSFLTISMQIQYSLL